MPYEHIKNGTGDDPNSCTFLLYLWLPKSVSYDHPVAAWKHAWTSECMSVVQDQVFGARPPTYKTVQDLDKKVRLYYLPPKLQIPGFGNGATSFGTEPEHPTVELTMQRYVAFAVKETSCFLLLLI
jgi:hypothetical protein